MVLKPIELPRRVRDRRDGALDAPRDHIEPLRETNHLVPVAHPHRLMPPGRIGAVEPRAARIRGDGDLHLPVLLLLPDGDDAAELLDEELHPVADAEDGDAVLLGVAEEAVGEGGGGVGVDGVGAAGEDDGAGAEVGDGGEGGGAGDAEGEDGELADAAGDEVGVLGAVVEDEDEVPAGGGGGYGAATSCGGGGGLRH